MKKKDFIRVSNLVLDILHGIDIELRSTGKIGKQEYNNLSAGRNNYAIELEYYLDLEGLFEDED